MTLKERLERSINPVDELKHCPSCHTDMLDLIAWYSASPPGAFDEWTCPVCYKHWDTWWMQDELCWDKIPMDFDPYRSENSLTPATASDDLTLCCDQPMAVCVCAMEDYFTPIMPNQFLQLRGVSVVEHVYDTDTYENENCMACEHYATKQCIPYRNVLRFVKLTNKKPPTKLTPCQWFEVDEQFIAANKADMSIIYMLIKEKATSKSEKVN